MAKDAEEEFIITQMETAMMEIGKGIKNSDKENYWWQLEIFMKENGTKINIKLNIIK